jgi:hypothetical protein
VQEVVQESPETPEGTANAATATEEEASNPEMHTREFFYLHEAA